MQFSVILCQCQLHKFPVGVYLHPLHPTGLCLYLAMSHQKLVIAPIFQIQLVRQPGQLLLRYAAKLIAFAVENVQQLVERFTLVHERVDIVAFANKPVEHTLCVIVAYLHVPPFISTLAMMEIIYGIGLIYTGATPLGGYITSYTAFSSGKFLGVSWLIWIALLVAAITWFIFNMTRHGKYMYAIGGNVQAAEVAGVPVQKTMVIIYAKAAAFYALAGFMLGAKAGGASINTGLGYEMEAIAACALGGVSVTGGRGKVSSAFIGVAVLELLKVALQFLGVDANAQYIAIGIVIFVAISLDIRKYVAKK